MTQIPKLTQSIPTPWDMVSIYAAAFGLFAPGTLMAARLRSAHSLTSVTQPPAPQG